MFQDRLADSTAIAEEAISSIRVIKAFAREEYEVDRYKKAVLRLFDTAIRRLWVSNLFWTTVGTLFMMALVGLFWFGGVSVLNGRLSSGDLVAFVFYAFNIARTVGGMSQLYTTFIVQLALLSGYSICLIRSPRPEIKKGRWISSL